MLAYHRIIESQNGWVGGDCRAHPVPTSCHGLVASHQLRLPRAPYNPTLSTSGDGAPTASLGSTAPVPDLWVKNWFFTSNLHLPSVRMKPFPVVLSLSDCVKSWFLLLLLSSPASALWASSWPSSGPTPAALHPSCAGTGHCVHQRAQCSHPRHVPSCKEDGYRAGNCSCWIIKQGLFHKPITHMLLTLSICCTLPNRNTVCTGLRVRVYF